MISFKLYDLLDKLNLDKDLYENIEITKVSSNSKDCNKALFVALKGERFDAHDFIYDAIKNGAIAILSRFTKEEFLLNNKDKLDFDPALIEKGNVIFIPFSDTLRGFGLASLCVREKFTGLIAAITGSCGKTTVKEMTYSILATMGKAMCTYKNFNNDVGVPLTLFNLDNSLKFAVVEQGASHPLDIKRTCEFVKSDVALINNVGKAHLEGFITYEGVYKGKSEILDDALSRGKVGIVPIDSPFYETWKKDYDKYFKLGKIKTFGFSDNADCVVSHVESKDDALNFDLTIKKETIHCSLNLLGEHNALNAAAAALLSYECGASLQNIKDGLNNARTLSGRLLKVKKDNFTFIDDAYNASFNATLSSLDVLKQQKGYRVMVFGDMGELGDETIALHESIGHKAQDCADMLLCIGPLSSYSVKAMGQNAYHFENHDALIEFLHNLILEKKDLVIMVKGSHSMHMDRIVDFLKTLG